MTPNHIETACDAASPCRNPVAQEGGVTNTTVQVELHDKWSIEVAIMVIIIAMFFASEKNHTAVCRRLLVDSAQFELYVPVHHSLSGYDKSAVFTLQCSKVAFLRRPNKTGEKKNQHINESETEHEAK